MEGIRHFSSRDPGSAGQPPMLDLPELYDLFAQEDVETPEAPAASKSAEPAVPEHRIMAYAATTVGNVRKTNEDNFYLPNGRMRGKENEVLAVLLDESRNYQFAVCDGMGGESFGDEASAIAVQAVAEFRPQLSGCESFSALRDSVNACFSAANNGICELVKQRRSGRSGSTMVMVHVERRTVYPFSIGDSRIYHFDGRKLHQLTEDHTLAMQKLKAGIYTEDEARRSPEAHMLTCFLGMDPEQRGIQASAYPDVSLKGKACVLLCTDGITDMCSDAEITQVLAERSGNPAQALIQHALANGGVDNATCIVICLQETEGGTVHEDQ